MDSVIASKILSLHSMDVEEKKYREAIDTALEALEHEGRYKDALSLMEHKLSFYQDLVDNAEDKYTGNLYSAMTDIIYDCIYALDSNRANMLRKVALEKNSMQKEN